MSYFGDGCLEQALLECIEAEMATRGIGVVDAVQAMAHVIDAVIERHHEAG